MKNTIKNTMSFMKNNKLFIIIMLFVLIVATEREYSYNVQADQVEILKQELLQEQKPSKIEIQKKDLIKLEREWRKKQMSIKAFEEKLDELIKEKLEIEPLIREKRNEILGIVK